MRRKNSLIQETTIDGEPCLRIELTRGLWAIADACDIDIVTQRPWRAAPAPSGKKFYAVSGSRPRNILLHREILSPPHGFFTDHINRDSLDNRRCNLRVATMQENCRNAMRENRTGFKGVYELSSGRFQASIRVTSKLQALGTFDLASEAARAYDNAARASFGEFAALNFPD